MLAVQHDSDNATTQKKRQTIRFRGCIGKQEVLILLDSGSVGTFISQQVAYRISQPSKPCEHIQFFTADGSPMVSDKMIMKLQWFIQGHTFSYDTRILPLKHYDMILGADWLEQHSPTWIHLKKN